MSSITLPEKIDKSAVSVIVDELRALITQKKPIIFDGSNVSHVSFCALQMLISAVRTANQFGLEYRLLDPSKKLLESARMAGADIVLGGASK